MASAEREQAQLRTCAVESALASGNLNYSATMCLKQSILVHTLPPVPPSLIFILFLLIMTFFFFLFSLRPCHPPCCPAHPNEGCPFDHWAIYKNSLCNVRQKFQPVGGGISHMQENDLVSVKPNSRDVWKRLTHVHWPAKVRKTVCHVSHTPQLPPLDSLRFFRSFCLRVNTNVCFHENVSLSPPTSVSVIG